MHIVHIINEPNGGGAELLVRELNQRLLNAGVESSALYLINPQNLELGEAEYCLGLSSVKSVFAPWLLWRFLRRFSKKRVLVHAHLTYPLYYLALVPRASNTVFLFTEHNTYNRRRSFKALLPIERWVYSRYDAIACISEGVRESLLDWIGYASYQERAKTILNGARLLDFVEDRSFTSSNLTVASLGSLTTQKGFDIGLDAVGLAAGVVASYVVIGEGPEKENLERRAECLGPTTCLELAGWQADIGPWLKKADILLIPSRWEGFGLVAIEALSTGLPVVASNVAGLNEILRDCDAAFLVEPGDPAAMAEAIRAYACKTAGEKESIARSARARAEMYGLDAMTSSYTELYKRLGDA